MKISVFIPKVGSDAAQYLQTVAIVVQVLLALL
jgi:hypothetical protein